MSTEVKPSATDPAVNNVATAGGAENASGSPSFKDEVNQLLGKSYADDDAARKALKELNSYVGKKIEAAQPASAGGASSSNVDDILSLRERLDERDLLDENPDLKPHLSLLRELRGTSGKSLKDVMQSPIFKDTVEKLRDAETAKKAKSVLSSNPRLGASTSKLQEAAEAMKAGNVRGARQSAVGAVLDSFAKS